MKRQPSLTHTDTKVGLFYVYGHLQKNSYVLVPRFTRIVGARSSKFHKIRRIRASEAFLAETAFPCENLIWWLTEILLDIENHTCGFQISKLCWRCVALYLILSWNSSSQDTVRLVQGDRSHLFHETTAVTYSYGLESGLILCLRTSTKKFLRLGAPTRRDRWCQIFQIP